MYLSHICSVLKKIDELANEKKKRNEKKRRVLDASFDFLHKMDILKVPEEEIMCSDYIAFYTGQGFQQYKGNDNICICQQLPEHPMMKDVKVLSEKTLTTFGFSGNFEAVIGPSNVIYVALLYMGSIPAYYVGQTSQGIKGRWKAHCSETNGIIHFLTGGKESVSKVPPPFHLAIAGAVLKQVATRSADRVAVVAVFAIDFSPEGTILCCNPDHNEHTEEPEAIKHFEQHYISAFKELFPDSDTEPKMMCLNAKKSTECHDCSAKNLRGCSVEVALSLLLHDLQLS